MNFPQAIKSGFQNYATFKGRAPRSEYWYWMLFVFIVGVVAGIIDGVYFGVRNASDSGPVGSIGSLALMLPGLAVSCRRLHDVDRSGWWFLIAFTVIGLIPLLWWYGKKGDEGINRFGAPEEVVLKRTP